MRKSLNTDRLNRDIDDLENRFGLNRQRVFTAIVPDGDDGSVLEGKVKALQKSDGLSDLDLLIVVRRFSGGAA